MTEKAVINAAILTVSLAVVGFTVLIFVHYWENEEQFAILETFVGFLETATKGLDKRVERFERLSIDGRNAKDCKDVVSPNYPMACILFLFVCGLFSTSQGCVRKEIRKNKAGKNKKRNRKWINKNRNRKKKRRIALKTAKRSKKRY